MPAWLIWLIAAGALGAAELLTLDLVLLMFAGAALVAMLVALVGLGVAPQLIAFIVAALGLLVLVRPIAKRHIEARSPGQIDGVQNFVGRTAIVSQTVDEHQGRIRIGGDEWTAVAQIEGDRFEVGDAVRVMAIRGATAVVTAEPA